MNEGRKEYTFLWFIENYSYCKDEEDLWSPTFYTDGLEHTKWFLVIYPKGRTTDASGYVSLSLYRCDDDGPEVFPLSFQFSLLAADGSAHHSAEFKHRFEYIDEYFRYLYGWCDNRLSDDRFISKDELCVRRRDEYLPNDMLTVCCKMWTGEGDVLKAGRISARSRPINVKLSFSHNVENFSTLKPDVKKTIHIRSHSNEAIVLCFSLCLVRDTYGEEQVTIENVSINLPSTVQKFKFFFKDVNEYLINCGKIAPGINNQKFLTLPLTKKHILNNKRTYFQVDKFSLVCECSIRTGVISEKIEEIIHDLPLNGMNQRSKVSDSKSVGKASEIMQNEQPGVSEDMKALYNEQVLTDVQLRTKTKSFGAHKNVLCARSPVFKAMFTNDMKEKIGDCIQIDDLEDDTIQQLLLFLYSDCLEPLQWRSATQFYYAADKYAVRKLKAMCSSFLVENLTPSNASELLLLAEVYSDSNLKKIVEGFILENEEQVFGSSEWES